MTFHRHHPRIDFRTELEDIPDRHVVVAEFPLGGAVGEVRRGIPGGFSHGSWGAANTALDGWTKGITPAVRWSDYDLGGVGVALLDRGLSGREQTGNTPIVFLYNAVKDYHGYPNAWLDGAGRHVVEYALVPRRGGWTTANIPRLAWEFNAAPCVVEGTATPVLPSFAETSANLILEAMRREGGEIELRLVECLGSAGQAEVDLHLPHRGAALTDLTGARRQPLEPQGETARGDTRRYSFPVRPQQIITLRFATPDAVAEPPPLTDWTPLVPEAKRAALHRAIDKKGHPPFADRPIALRPPPAP
jgi:alpha-mannosidase